MCIRLKPRHWKWTRGVIIVTYLILPFSLSSCLCLQIRLADRFRQFKITLGDDKSNLETKYVGLISADKRLIRASNGQQTFAEISKNASGKKDAAEAKSSGKLKWGNAFDGFVTTFRRFVWGKSFSFAFIAPSSSFAEDTTAPHRIIQKNV